MNLFLLHKLPVMVYHAFVRDGRRIYRLLPRPLRVKFWIVLVIQFFSALIETFTLLLVSLFAVSVAAPEVALNNFIVKQFLESSPALAEWCRDPRHLVGFTSILMTVFILFKAIFSTLVTYKTSIFAESVSLHIGQQTLRRYLNKSFYWHMSPESSSVIHKFDQRGILAQFLVALLLLYSNVICCVALFTSLALAEPVLTLVMVMIFGVGSLGTYLFLRRRLDGTGQASTQLNLRAAAERLALVQGLREVLMYRRQDFFYRKMAGTIGEQRRPLAFMSFSGYLPSLVLEFLGFSSISVVTIAMLLIGVPMPRIISSASILMLTSWRALPAVNRSLSYAVFLRAQRAASLNCLELLETFIAEEPAPLPDPDPNFRFEREIVLRGAAFRYPAGREEVLSSLDLKLSRGETVGLIGPSGAGKSTLALLLTGLVKPERGCFLVDGRELDQAGQVAYAQRVGFVPQTPLLLPGSVADNVAFSQWGEEYDRSAVESACHQAAMDFVFQHPDGLDQQLGTGGQGLSGGQAQRVSIARALFTRPEILIFDEATSALDQANEDIIAETIRRLPEHTTVIIIAHRLTTVENCDRLIWMDEGRIKAEGTPAEILPRYRAALAESGVKNEAEA